MVTAIFCAMLVVNSSVDRASDSRAQVFAMLSAIDEARRRIDDIRFEFEVTVHRRHPLRHLAQISTSQGWTHYSGGERYAEQRIERDGDLRRQTRAYWGKKVFAGHQTPEPGAYLRETDSRDDQRARTQQLLTGGVDWLLHGYGLGDASVDNLRLAVELNRVELREMSPGTVELVCFSQNSSEILFDAMIDMNRGPAVTRFRTYQAGEMKLERLVEMVREGSFWIPSIVIDRQYLAGDRVPARELRAQLKFVERGVRKDGLAYMSAAGIVEGILHLDTGQFVLVEIPSLTRLDSATTIVMSDDGSAGKGIGEISPGMSTLLFGSSYSRTVQGLSLALLLFAVAILVSPLFQRRQVP